MRKRGLKIAAMILSGGILLQAAGCSYLAVDQIASLIVYQVISTLIQNILSGASAAA